MNRDIKHIIFSILFVINLTHSINTSPNLQDLCRAPCPQWQMGAVILDQCSLCLLSRSPLPLDLSLRVSLRICPASKEGAFMRANLHLHCCKLRPRNEASGETAAHCLQGQSWSENEGWEGMNAGRGETWGQQIKRANFFFKQKVKC